MKNLILTSILAISFLTANASQFLENSIVNDTITKKETKPAIIEVYPVLIAEEEADEPFDFNIKDYLPVGFNPYLNLDEYDLEFSGVEEDEPFDFNTNDYLPVGFNLSRDILDSIIEIAIEEEDAPFDFDHTAYLPKDFNTSI